MRSHAWLLSGRPNAACWLTIALGRGHLPGGSPRSVQQIACQGEFNIAADARPASCQATFEWHRLSMQLALQADAPATNFPSAHTPVLSVRTTRSHTTCEHRSQRTLCVTLLSAPSSRRAPARTVGEPVAETGHARALPATAVLCCLLSLVCADTTETRHLDQHGKSEHKGNPRSQVLWACVALLLTNLTTPAQLAQLPCVRCSTQHPCHQAHCSSTGSTSRDTTSCWLVEPVL